MPSGIFPTRLKCSLVKPLFKKGDRHDVTNYRPASLLTSFSTVFEKVLYDRLIKHIHINNTVVEEQFSVRTSSSADKAAFKLFDEILNALNNKMMNFMFYLPCIITLYYIKNQQDATYWIYIILTYGMHQWLLLQFLVFLMMDAESIRNV